MFADKYGAKYEKAVACLTKDREALLAFFDFRAPRIAKSNHFRTVRADPRSKGESARRRRSRRGAPAMMSREWEL